MNLLRRQLLQLAAGAVAAPAASWRNCRRGRFMTMLPGNASAPIPKFASYRGEFDCELRNQRSTSNSMILVRFLNLKFLNEFAAI